MKKVIILLVLLLTLTGCKSKYPKEEKLSCSFTNTYEGSEFTTNIDVEVKKNIVTNATATMTFKEKSLAKTMCDVMSKASDADNDNLICNDDSIIVNNYHKSVSKDKMTKDKFIEYMQSQDFTCE